MTPAPMPHVTRTAHGIELYFPPLRVPAAALGLAVFGFLCTALPAVGGGALLSMIGSDAHGLLAVVLLAGFVLPFFGFGLVFIGLAVYQLANALIVRAEPAGIVTARRAFGLTFARRRLPAGDIIGIEAQIPSRFQSPFIAEPVYRLVAVARAPARGGVVVAEGLVGKALAERVRTLIEDAAGLPHRKEE